MFMCVSLRQLFLTILKCVKAQRMNGAKIEKTVLKIWEHKFKLIKYILTIFYPLYPPWKTLEMSF